MSSLQGTFRETMVGPLRVNLVDQINSGGVQWSAGAALVEAIPTQPALTERWLIDSYAIFYGNAATYVGGNYGRLGKLLSALMMNQTPTRPGMTPFFPPGDVLNIQTIWDGENDPPWPSIPTGASGWLAPLVTNHITISPASPIELRAGDQLSIGLFLSPSLVQGNGWKLLLTDASWAVSYTSEPAEL